MNLSLFDNASKKRHKTEKKKVSCFYVCVDSVIYIPCSFSCYHSQRLKIKKIRSFAKTVLTKQNISSFDRFLT